VTAGQRSVQCNVMVTNGQRSVQCNVMVTAGQRSVHCNVMVTAEQRSVQCYMMVTVGEIQCWFEASRFVCLRHRDTLLQTGTNCGVKYVLRGYLLSNVCS
jgi:hypothetical protein